MLYVLETFPSIDDEAVVALAILEDRLLVTLDRGIGERVVQTPTGVPGVLMLTLGRADLKDFIGVVLQALSGGEAPLRGNLTILRDGEPRSRLLPTA